jgi:DNA modification methylase
MDCGVSGFPDMAAGALPIDDGFDVSLANQLAHLESYNKHLYRPNSYLHKWWARRCGTTFRLILKHLVAEPGQRDYYAPGGLVGQIILDPMMGGGTTLHEAIRLGANVVGADIDPIPVLQARASLDEVAPERLEGAFGRFFDGIAARLRPHVATECRQCGAAATLRFMLYGQRRQCGCDGVLAVDSLTLREARNEATIRLCPFCGSVTDGEHRCQESVSGELARLVEKGACGCPRCGQRYRPLSESPYFRRYRPVALAGFCRQHGLFFAAPNAADLARLEEAERQRMDLDLGPVEAYAVGPGPKSADLGRRGIGNYLELFSGRQLIYLDEAIRLLKGADPAAQLSLALLVSTSLEFNSLLCGYKGAGERRPGAIRHTFSHHAYSFPYTALENNPAYPFKSSGTLQKLFHDRVRRARHWAAAPKERRIGGGGIEVVAIAGERDSGREVKEVALLNEGSRRFLLLQGSSARLALPDDSVDHVVTDPPYFDSVQYGDLAAFFRVWLRRLAPEGADWSYDLDQSAVDPQANGAGQYTAVLSAIFAECRRVLRKRNGRLIFTFHHWNPKGWAALTVALKRAGFGLVNFYVVHSENPVSVHIAGLRALTHDAILVLAPAERGGERKWERPGKITTADSETFCRECAALLGWLLGEPMDEPEILATWQRQLE